MSSRPPGGGIGQSELETFIRNYDADVASPSDLAAAILNQYYVAQRGGRPVPLTLTVEDAAKVLRISRSSAYGLANEWRHTKGESGLPVLELGRTLRVPTARLAEMLGVTVDQLLD